VSAASAQPVPAGLGVTARLALFALALVAALAVGAGLGAVVPEVRDREPAGAVSTVSTAPHGGTGHSTNGTGTG